ncbi:MAG: 50S ribosomal protein L17 [Candidatus Omnitrophota bacterium]
MRHKKLATRLGRQKAHRKATIKNLCRALLIKGRIKTTRALAEASRRRVEKLITLGKKDTLHSRRQVFKLLGDRSIVGLLFREIAPLFSTRTGGYTRIIRIASTRAGDNASLVILEFTEQRPLPQKAKSVKKTKAKKEEVKAKPIPPAKTAAGALEELTEEKLVEKVRTEKEKPAAAGMPTAKEEESKSPKKKKGLLDNFRNFFKKRDRNT